MKDEHAKSPGSREPDKTPGHREPEKSTGRRRTAKPPGRRKGPRTRGRDEALCRFLEEVHGRYLRTELLHTDPLSAVHRYKDPRDQEVVGFVAAGLAFGNVRSVIASVGRALGPLGPRPARALGRLGPVEALRAAEGFNHRWVFAPDLAGLYRLLGAGLREAGGLEPLFAEGMRRAGGEAASDVRPGAAALVAGLRALAPSDVELGRKGTGYFLSQAEGPGAAKRLHLFLRWMVRKDALDLGLWKSARPSQLIVPLDTHIAHLGRLLGMTARSTAGLGMALDITAALRLADPEDPVKYDFALSRLGILGTCPMERQAGSCAACELYPVCLL
jgi:uncharacterized protein (TIGR02757 family)